MNKVLYIASVLLLLSACAKEEQPFGKHDRPYELTLPEGFPEMPVPDDNALTQKRVKLGKKLFFDPRLSRDGSVSCGSCHFQHLAFSDGQALSTGIDNRTGLRNAPGLFNLAWQERFMRDGGVPSLELQVLAPIHDENEMDFNANEVVELLQDDQHYQQFARDAYDRDFDLFVLTRAIAAFERSLISGNSPYDAYLAGNTEALSESQTRGMELFFSADTDCGTCHSGFLLADNDYHNIGLSAVYADEGRARITLDPLEEGKFMTPSLRNIAVTAPYMHDGSIASLEEVLDHFIEGGQGHPLQDSRIRPLDLTAQDKADLINFMNALTDQAFLTNPEFSHAQ